MRAPGVGLGVRVAGVTVTAQGCTAGGLAPAGDPYECDRCDLAETGVCGAPSDLAPALPVPGSADVVRALDPDRQAALYEVLAEAAELDEAITFTHPRLYAATKRLTEIHERQLRNAEVICGGPPKPAHDDPTLYRR